MDLHSLSPTLEQHSLNESCHLPILPSNPKPNPNPNPNPNADPNLRALSSTAFKREARKKRKERKRQEKLAEKLESLLAFETPTRPPDSASASVVEWPCSEIRSVPNPEPTGWPVPDPNPNPKPTQAPIAPPEPQQNVLKQCQDFLAANDNDDDDDEDEEEDVGESGNFEFFMGLFEKDGELRGFYEKNWEKGDFCCLVCGAIGEKMGKRYGNCVGLVQHANTVSKTRRRVAHRNFGRAVCRVLGWEIDKLPGVFDGLSVVRDVQAQENIHKQVDTIEEAGPHKGVGGPVGPDKGKLIDYMEADPVAD